MFLVGSAEEIMNPVTINSVYKIGAMAKNKLKFENNKISCPFDKDRHGIVLGEGAGFLILESEDNALKRNAQIFGEIMGYGMTCDGYHMTQPSGEGGLRSMEMTLEWSSDKNIEDIFFNCHATSTPIGDRKELESIDSLIDKNFWD